jgi:hypothetical protein
MRHSELLIDFEPDMALDYRHRILNFAEDLFFSELSPCGLGTVPNMDTAISQVVVVLSSPRSLGSVSRAIRRTLRHHNLLAQARLSRVTEAGLVSVPLGQTRTRKAHTSRCLGRVRPLL